MKNKFVLGTIIVMTLAMMLGLGALSVSAQGPVTNDQPWTAVYTYGEPRQIQAQTAQWFKFDYAGDRKQISIQLPEGRTSGLEFRVYTLDQVLRLDQEDKPVGRGTSSNVPCDAGTCLSVHLTWQGGFAFGGPFFVQVYNPQNRWLTFQLFISGESVSLGPQIPPTPTPAPTLAPTPILLTLPMTTTTSVTTTMPTTPTVPLTTTMPLTTSVVPPPAPPAAVVVAPVPTVPMAPTNNSPYFAVNVRDNKEQVIGPNGRLWYKFAYGGDKSSVLIVLPVGNATGVNFRVYTPQQAEQYTDQKYVGMGNTGKQACETGQCSSDDFAWKGAFGAPGTYFIEVVNSMDKERTFKLHIEGTNINIED